MSNSNPQANRCYQSSGGTSTSQAAQGVGVLTSCMSVVEWLSWMGVLSADAEYWIRLLDIIFLSKISCRSLRVWSIGWRSCVGKQNGLQVGTMRAGELVSAGLPAFVCFTGTFDGVICPLRFIHVLHKIWEGGLAILRRYFALLTKWICRIRVNMCCERHANLGLEQIGKSKQEPVAIVGRCSR